MSAAASVNNNVPVSDVSSSQLDGMDKETRLMVLCYTMLNLLDDRMQGQMDIINARNTRATQLQGVVSDLQAVQDKFSGTALPTDKFPDPSPGTPEEQALIDNISKSLSGAEISNLVPGGLIQNGQVTKSDLDGAVTKVQGMMDSDTSLQQMDMFTLQSVFSKRNQTFELMSNTLKKTQDTNQSLIRNF